MSGYLQKKTNYPYFKCFLTDGIKLNSNFGIASTNGVNFSTIDIISNNSDYNTGTFTYTVPISGLYRFNITLSCYNTSNTSDDSINIGFNINNGTRYYGRFDNPEHYAGNGTQYLINYTTIVLLTKNDTVKVFCYDNTTDQIYYGNSFFEGYLITSFSA
jgi:hypothetical protein